MGTTLTGTTPQDTYDSLIKVTDNGPLSATAKYLSDGLGNDSALAVSTAAVGIGTSTPATLLDVNGIAGAQGIKFPATQVVSADNNTLDDYEDGTWTPQISNGVTNVAVSNSFSRYTKIGRQVTINTRIVNADLSSFSAGDTIEFVGLPFTSSGDFYSTIYVRAAVAGNLVRYLEVEDGTTTALTDLLVSELVDDATDYFITATYFA